MTYRSFAILLAALASPALAQDVRWSTGGGEGDLEYFIDQDSMRFFIACPTAKGQADLASAVTLHYNDMSEVEKFSVTVNGVTVEGPLSADSTASAGQFTALVENLRKADAVVRHGDTTLRLPRANAAEVLPAPGKDFPCNLLPQG